MTKSLCLALILTLPVILPLGACNSTPGAPSDQGSETTAAEGIPVVTQGAYVCRGGAPGSGFQIVSTKEIAAGGDADLTVAAPRSSDAARHPQTAVLRCEVDVDWCAGSSCRKYPLVDFMGKDAKGMTWKQVSTDGETKGATFSAMVHNGDTEPHTVRLVLELPSSWKPGPDDTPGK